MLSQEQTELLDRYARDLVTPEERTVIEQQMRADEAFCKDAQAHLLLLRQLRQYGKRLESIQLLESIYEETKGELKTREILLPRAEKPSAWKKYWPLTAVAASVALISILGTLFITQSLETKQTAYYKELRRNVEQIKKSQNLMMADIAGVKEKVVPAPGRYAGSGFLISAFGYVATSYHVVKEADSIYVENEKFGRVKTSILHKDAENDLAILKIETADFRPLKALPYTILTEEASLGESVYTLGFPREDIVFGEGSISAGTGYRQNPNAYQVSVPVNPGNSGGPLFNAQGDIVGIISGIQTETSGAAFAIKSSILVHMLQEIPADTLSKPLVLSRANTLRNLPKVQQIRKWREHVFIVRVYKNAE